VIETLDPNLFHVDHPPLKLLDAVKQSVEDKRFFLSEHLLNVGYTAVLKKKGDWWIGWIEEVSGRKLSGTIEREPRRNATHHTA
jgi:hypothetical protein